MLEPARPRLDRPDRRNTRARRLQGARLVDRRRLGDDRATSGDDGPVTVEAIDAGADADGSTPRIAALDLVTPVFNMTEWPAKDPSKTTEERQGAQRLGYLRRGQVLAVKPKVVKKGNCSEGWYELASGGFVCGKSVTTDLASKELETAPHPPYTDRPLPYDYGLNLTNGAPLYRRRPLKKERTDLEKGLAVGKTKKDAEAPRPPSDGDAPWYLKDHKGQRPQVTIDDIRTNEQGGLVVVRMVRGFYLALDKSLSTASGKFWRNTAGFLAPADHILVHKATTEFEGVKIGAEGEKRHLPLGWVVSPRAHHYRIEPGDPTRADEKNGKLRRGDPVDRFTIVQLTGKSVTIEGRGYFETDEGWWLRDADAAVTRPGPAPKNLGAGEKWIDVNLSTQSLVAFEGDKPVYATIVSTGRHDDEDKSKDHRTVQGEFQIREKHIAATMEDDGASDGPYSIQDVPWIMYFEGGYALHGAFWHSRFGRERSHGCVNMTPHDAKQVFGWAGPNLPEGWHGVRATKENPGTRIVVHEDPKPAASADTPAAAPAPAKKSDKSDAPAAAPAKKSDKSDAPAKKSDKSEKSGKSEKSEKRDKTASSDKASKTEKAPSKVD
ncbi:MAG: L,D-transpeptidase [Labilithrix sp.]|nr:L,D-transpeptidase [Labilithrix sp.]